MRASWCGASVLRYLITVLKQLGLSSLTGTSYLSLFIYCSSPLPSFSTEHVFSTLCELTTLCLRFLIYVSSHRGDFLHCFPLLCPTTSGSPKPQPRTLDSWGKEMFKRFQKQSMFGDVLVLHSRCPPDCLGMFVAKKMDHNDWPTKFWIWMNMSSIDQLYDHVWSFGILILT